ncbi:MAG: cytochrome C [Hyphomicrobiales bacterium]|nr:MAG: cytochrome C [Hyphomicrobiales bacterium]
MTGRYLRAGAGASALYALAVAAALAHGGAVGVVKERMDAMSAMAKAVKATAEMFKGTAPYDADAVKRTAAIINKHSGDALTKLFPQGSSHPPSEARKAIWRDWQTFADLARRLEVQSAGLAAAAENEPDRAAGASSGGSTGAVMMASSSSMTVSENELAAMPAKRVFGLVVKTCSDCHSDFRRERK